MTKLINALATIKSCNMNKGFDSLCIFVAPAEGRPEYLGSQHTDKRKLNNPVNCNWPILAKGSIC